MGQLQPFHVFLDDGQTVPVEAAAFEHVVNTQEQIVFVDANGDPIKQIFLRAQSVKMIIPDSAIAKTHLFVALQTKVDDLAERVGRIETAMNSSQSPSGE